MKNEHISNRSRSTRMMRPDEITRLQDIANELGDLVPQEVRVCDNGGKPISTNFANTVIYYHEAFGLPADDHCIRFLLLHEGAHALQPQIFKGALLRVTSTAFGLATIFYFWKTGPHLSPISPEEHLDLPRRWGPIAGGILATGLFVAALRDFHLLVDPRRSIHRDELNADLYAAEVLRDQFDVDRPSLIMEQVFDYHREVAKAPPFNRRKTIGAWSHPTEHDRLDNVRLRVDRVRPSDERNDENNERRDGFL